MEHLENKLTSLSNVVLTGNGQDIAFTLMEGSSPLTRLRFALDEVPEFIAYLCQAVQAVHPEPRTMDSFATVEAIGAGLVGCADPTKTLLVLRLAGMDLAFALESTAVAALGSSFAQAAATLSASGLPQ